MLDVVAGTDRSRLAILLFQSGTPAPAAIQFFAFNARPVTRTLSHPDPNNTLFLQVRFPQGSISSIGGQPANPNDSVLVSIQPQSGLYGFTLGAGGATFSSAAAPTATFFYGRYGDFTASRTGTRYSSATAYAQALEVWHEEVLDRFNVVAGSGSAGTDALAGSVTSSGTYLVAAPR
ncbi:MAG: hypothetical protein HY560_06755 [Gemmatimonadetes bacterium]|nr:hypothetical protein [Gemmatimonadota bacterium]